MNYLSDEVLTILVQEVFENRGTLDVNPVDVHETIQHKFGVTAFPVELQNRINECIKNLEDFDPTQKHITVFEPIDFSLPFGSRDVESSSEEGSDFLNDDDLKELDTLIDVKETTEMKPEKSPRSSYSRRRIKTKRYYNDLDSDDLDQKMQRKANIQEHNRMVRQAHLEESPGMQLLRKFARSCRLGNKGLRGLYDIKDPIEREKELIRRLHKDGETWEGEYPTAKEIHLAQLSTKRFKENLKKITKGNEGGKKRRVRRYKRKMFSFSPDTEGSDLSD